MQYSWPEIESNLCPLGQCFVRKLEKGSRLGQCSVQKLEKGNVGSVLHSEAREG